MLVKGATGAVMLTTTNASHLMINDEAIILSYDLETLNDGISL